MSDFTPLNHRATAALHRLHRDRALISPFGPGMLLDDRGWETRVRHVGPSIVVVDGYPAGRLAPRSRPHWTFDPREGPPFKVRLDDRLTCSATLQWLEHQHPLYLAMERCPVAPWPAHRVVMRNYAGSTVGFTVQGSEPVAGTVHEACAYAVVAVLELLVGRLDGR